MTPLAPWNAEVWTSVYPFWPRTSQIRRETFHSLPSRSRRRPFFVVFLPIVVMYSSLNLSTTNRRMSDVFPTAPSPRISTFFLKYSDTPDPPIHRGARHITVTPSFPSLRRFSWHHEAMRPVASGSGRRCSRGGTPARFLGGSR